MGSGESKTKTPLREIPEETTLEELSVEDSEYKQVVAMMSLPSIPFHNPTLVRDYKISKVEKVRNPRWEDNYAKTKEAIRQSSWGTWFDPKEEQLFHGTDKVDVILKEGFDVRNARPTGMFGPGKSWPNSQNGELKADHQLSFCSETQYKKNALKS
jgi:hypothetical protein